MTTEEEVEVSIHATIKEVELLVTEAWVGPPKAFFEIPLGDGFVRGIYRVYIVQAPTIRDALSGLRGCIIEQITAASSRSMTTNLVWRLEDKIEMDQTEGDGMWRARTRLTVLPEGDEQ